MSLRHSDRRPEAGVDTGRTTALTRPARHACGSSGRAGFLRVNGSLVPQFRTADESFDSPGALVFWTQARIGLWVHRKSFSWLESVSQLDMKPEEWLPAREVAAEWPAFIEETT